MSKEFQYIYSYGDTTLSVPISEKTPYIMLDIVPNVVAFDFNGADEVVYQDGDEAEILHTDGGYVYVSDSLPPLFLELEYKFTAGVMEGDKFVEREFIDWSSSGGSYLGRHWSLTGVRSWTGNLRISTDGRWEGDVDEFDYPEKTYSDETLGEAFLDAYGLTAETGITMQSLGFTIKIEGGEPPEPGLEVPAWFEGPEPEITYVRVEEFFGGGGNVVEANDDEVRISEQNEYGFQVVDTSQNDTVTDTLATTYEVVEGPRHGSVRLSEPGIWIYTVEAEEPQDDSFVYRVTDRFGNTDTARASLESFNNDTLADLEVITDPAEIDQYISEELVDEPGLVTNGWDFIGDAAERITGFVSAPFQVDEDAIRDQEYEDVPSFDNVPWENTESSDPAQQGSGLGEFYDIVSKAFASASLNAILSEIRSSIGLEVPEQLESAREAKDIYDSYQENVSAPAVRLYDGFADDDGTLRRHSDIEEMKKERDDVFEGFKTFVREKLPYGEVLVDDVNFYGEHSIQTYGLTFDRESVARGNDHSNRVFFGSESAEYFADEGDDYVFGNIGDDTFYGGPGSDWLSGDEGADTVVGGEGNDQLLGGAGEDFLLGEEGDDLLFFDSGDDRAIGGTGIDTIVLRAVSRSDVMITGSDDRYEIVSERYGTDSVAEIEMIEFADGTVAIEDIVLDEPEVGPGPSMPNPSPPSDPPGSEATTAVIGDGDTVRGALMPAGDADWFRLTAEIGYDYWVSATGEGDDPLSGYRLRAADTEERLGPSALSDEDDLAGIAINAADLGPSESLGTADRDYFVIVDSPDTGPVSGQYRLHVTREEGRTPNTSVSLAPGESYDGSFEYRGDADMVALEVEAGQSYAVVFDITESAAADELQTLESREFDLRIGSESAAQDALPEVARASNQRIVSFAFTAEQSGPFYLLAENDMQEFDRLNVGEETGRYAVRLVENLPEDQTSPSRFALGETVTDRLDFIGDTDWWGIELEGGTSYRVQFEVDTEAGPGASVIEIFDADGAAAGRMEAPDEGPNRFPVDGTFTPDADGLYFFAGAAPAAIGESRLQVSMSGEVIEGADRGETLTGTPGNDTLNGNGGADILIGGGGTTVMSGGDGADAFVFRPGEGPVTVTDFDRRAGDMLALDDLFFGFGETGVDIRDATKAQARAARESGRFEYDTATGELWIDGDGAGGGDDPVLVAVLDGAPGFTYADVVLF